MRILPDERLEIVVKDHGIGITDVARARTPMYTTGGEERSGMGFTIMESFMDTLRVRSVPGRGTTVTMCRRIRRRALSRRRRATCSGALRRETLRRQSRWSRKIPA